MFVSEYQSLIYSTTRLHLNKFTVTALLDTLDNHDTQALVWVKYVKPDLISKFKLTQQFYPTTVISNQVSASHWYFT